MPVIAALVTVTTATVNHGSIHSCSEELSQAHMRDDEKVLVLSLVKMHLLHNPHYLSWVPHYTMIRWLHGGPVSVNVGGHYRRRPPYARTLAALGSCARLQELVFPEGAVRVGPPPTAKRRRYSEDGSQIAPKNRVYEFLDP